MDRNNIDSIRSEIDKVDKKLTELIEKRMELVSLVADYKKKNKTEILDTNREEEVLQNVLLSVKNHQLTDSIKATFQSIMDHSKDFQKKRVVEKANNYLQKGAAPARKKYALIGEKLSHSISHRIHEIFFNMANIDASYELIEVKNNELFNTLILLKEQNYSGINVTIPYKTEIIPFLGQLSDEALKIGAVNTIIINNTFIGHNTDYFGFGKALKYFNVKIEDKRCAVLGSGGASRSVVSYFEDNGAREITIITRDTHAASLKYPKLNSINIKEFNSKGYDIVINTTPMGMFPKTDLSPISKEQLKGADFVMDLIYNPSKTKLLKYAKDLNIKYANGLYMLVAQAACAQEIWQHSHITDDIINNAYRKIKDEN